jgi:hypothetical protein
VNLKRNDLSMERKGHTQGIWQSANPGWLFIRGDHYVPSIKKNKSLRRRWFINLNKEMPGLTIPQGVKLLRTYGLWMTPFATRREAMKALESVLEGIGKK